VLPLANVADGHRTELLASRRNIELDLSLAHHRTPEDRDVAVFTRANEAADVEVGAREIGARIEEVIEVAAPQNMEGFVRIETREKFGIRFRDLLLERFERARGGITFAP
jgi:hypothetical protein